MNFRGSLNVVTTLSASSSMARVSEFMINQAPAIVFGRSVTVRGISLLGCIQSNKAMY